MKGQQLHATTCDANSQRSIQQPSGVLVEFADKGQDSSLFPCLHRHVLLISSLYRLDKMCSYMLRI